MEKMKVEVILLRADGTEGFLKIDEKELEGYRKVWDSYGKLKDLKEFLENFKGYKKERFGEWEEKVCYYFDVERVIKVVRALKTLFDYRLLEVYVRNAYDPLLIRICDTELRTDFFGLTYDVEKNTVCYYAIAPKIPP